MGVTSKRPSRRTAAAAAAAAAVVLCVGVLVSCTSSSSDGTAPTASPTTSSAGGPTPPSSTATGPAASTPSPPPSSTYAGPPPATAPVVGATTLPPVPTGSPAAFGDGLVATVSAVREAQASGSVPGDVAGPAVAVSVRVENGSDAPVDLGGLTVTATYGADAVPATLLTGAPSAPAEGVLAPRKSAEGVWAFTVPSGQASSLVLTISSISSGTTVVVRG
ncbi:hypothetical protein [Quadrisphaera setariae]|uniref:DUF4352 domain-containing protein n=1 Tax=Quadrisphaera setariae TaxID=2593304 RepID=A0A5C8ZH10_9ACTN|nr:hypothetical protein [Quadrisphaera setariae]TXR56373.1 hypothetical protein FMM08_09735 [Quadrisphaera setariae]